MLAAYELKNLAPKFVKHRLEIGFYEFQEVFNNRISLIDDF